MVSPRTWRRGRRRLQTPRNALMLCLFALMLLTPVAANASVASQADAQRDLMAQATEVPVNGVEEPVAEPTEEPFVDPTEEPTVEPTEEPFVEPTEEPEGEQLGAIEIEYRECAPGYDVPGTDPETALMECDRVDDVLFEITASDGVPSSQLTGEFGDSHVSFTEVPTGATDIRQIDAPGDVYVTCNGIVQNGGPETGEMPLTVNANDTSVQWNLLDEEVAFCNWFAVPEGGELLGAVEIEYRECEEGYTFLDGTNEDDLDQMLMACAQADEVEFTIDQGGPEGDSQETGEFGDSHISFTEVPTGLRTVTQSIPFDDTYVVCNGIVQNGGPETGVMEVPVTNGVIEWDLLDEEVVFCNWFVAGAPGLLSATEMPTGEQVGSINVDYWECPAAYDLAAADPTALETDCTATANGVPFQISNAGGVIETQETGDINDGVVAFAEVPTGITTISRVNPPTVPRVSCEGIVSNGGSETGLMELAAPSGSVEWNLLDDEVVYCDWYTVPMGEAGDLTIYKWTCPEGYDVHGANANPPVDCTQATDGVTFVLGDTDPNTVDLQTDTGDSQPGAVYFGGLQPGSYTITETLPEGTESAFVWNCNFLLLTFGGQMPISEGSTFNLLFNGGTLRCDWFNVPGTDSSVTITKWYCPEGVPYDQDQAYYEQNCTQYHEGVEFKLTHAEGSTFDTTDANGQAGWTAVPLGPFSIQEYIPQEYGEPIVFCGFTAMVDGAIVDGFPVRVEAPGGYYEAELELPNTSYFCQWYNVPGEPGEITIYKYTCPEGYDLYAWGANPMDDCREGTNDVTFNLEGEGYDSQSDTGDSVDYAVTFGGLEPGTYTAVESVPPDTQYVFVLDCYGQKVGKLRPYPLSMGDTLEIELGAGESIECYWYNVPEYDEGRLTVYKYQCSTETYASDVDCEIYEDGKTFDLVMWNGDEWEYADTGTTDGGGMTTWGGIDPGEYWLDEQDGEWCHLASEQLSDDGNWINVYDGQETIVTVYNCSSDPGDKGKPGKTPTKYPNTGIGPDEGPGGPAELPAFAPLAGLLALLATRRRRVADLVSAPVTGRQRLGDDSMFHTLSRRKLAALLAVPLGGTALVRSGILAQGDQVIEPIDGTPPGGTPASLCLPATPGAEGDDADDCPRGAVPFNLKIEAIEVDAPVEILETVGGVMQQPSDEAHVAWYKESARLGETGNLLIAGHLNWWGHPEAVFFDLGTLREGDEVVLLDEEENAFTYEVEWVRQESNLEPPAEEVLGMTGYEAVTLMTCGGQWDSSISEYDERTVVRAMRVADEGTPEA